MRVTIGKYPKWVKKTQTYSPPKQKVSVRIDPWDTWSMDHTLAHIIHPMLVQLRATKNGAPYTDDADVPEHLRSTNAVKPDPNDVDSLHFERWDWIMDEMIWAFAQVVDEDAEGQFYTGNSDILWQQVDTETKQPIGAPVDLLDMEAAVSYMVHHGPNHTEVHDEAGHRAWVERKQNGFRLFGKYYSNLWD